ncbi:McrC family protein [Shewanella sp. SR44-3]|uniref:McrC family protein n=1 Tax=Shewanella sp. SR44-3 TaxID=2760936 RepID=UPI0015FB9F2C|nr:McrC family protein [Shewanella sp. SR44-3]MBB1267908.1 McrC family protein [Shewanella sp. SR44-3]
MLKGLKQPKKTNITVFEYGLLSASDKAAKDERVNAITQHAFEYLKKCCLCDVSESRFLKLTIAHGMEVLQVQNYAGVILCPDGTQIEVLPKVAKHSDMSPMGDKLSSDNNCRDSNYCDNKGSEERARLSLLMMLKSLKQFRHIETEVASIKKQKMPLMEIFIAQFLTAVNHLIKKGIKSDYVREQSNSPFLKGKLLHSQQLKHNFINRHKFYVEYDAYLMDRAENRLIHSALGKVAGYTQVTKSKKLVQELLFAFDEVPLSTNYKDDFSRIKLQRGMQHYDVPLSWARLILQGYSPQSMLGENNAYSLLFPMEAVFESFVAQYLRKKVQYPSTLSAQVQSTSLVTYDAKNYFHLRPDLLITTPDLGSIVLDTKWKLIDMAKPKGKNKFGLSQSDFYQMLGYGHKYLHAEGELVLIYPKTSSFNAPFEHSFNYDTAGKLRLWVIPFDISHDAKDRINHHILGLNHD